MSLSDVEALFVKYVSPLAGRLRGVEEGLDEVKAETGRLWQTLRAENNRLWSALTVMEDRDRRKNLLFWGMPEEKGEDCRKRIVDAVDELLEVNIHHGDIERAHRLHTSSSPRPIIVRFERHITKERVLAAKEDRTLPLYRSNIYISEDASKATRIARSALQDVARRARQDGFRPVLAHNQLFVGEWVYTYDHSTGSVNGRPRSRADRVQPNRAQHRPAAGLNQVHSQTATAILVQPPANQASQPPPGETMMQRRRRLMSERSPDSQQQQQQSPAKRNRGEEMSTRGKTGGPRASWASPCRDDWEGEEQDTLPPPPPPPPPDPHPSARRAETMARDPGHPELLHSRG